MVSNKRKQIAAQARNNNQQKIYFNQNHKPIANIAYQSQQIHATPLRQSTPILHQQYKNNPYLHNSNLYLNQRLYMKVPPMAVYPPPVQQTPPMPEPSTEISTTFPVNLQNRIGQPRKNPIIEHHQQWVMGQSGKLKTKN